MGLSTAAWLPPPMVMRYLVDDVVAPGRNDLLLAALAVLAACLCAEKLLRLAEEFCFGRFQTHALADLQDTLVAHVLRLPKPFFDRRLTGALTRSLTEDVESARRVLGGRRQRFWPGAAAAGRGLLPGLPGVAHGARCAGAPAAALLGAAYLGGKAFLLSRRRLEQQAEASGCLQETLAGVTAVKAAAGERREGAEVDSRFEQWVLGTAEQAVVGSAGAAFLQSMPGVGRVLALAVGAILVMRGEWTLGSLLAFQAYLSDVFGPAQYLSSVTLQFQAARASLERMGSVLDRAPEGRCDDGAVAVALGGELELRDVSFAYPDARRF